MLKQKLILYSLELSDCPHFSTIFGEEYEIIAAKSEREFFNGIYNLPLDAAIICSCSAQENDVDILFQLDSLTGPIAVLACSKVLNSEFVRRATQRGIERFLICDMEPDKIRDIINNAIRDTGLKKYFNSYWPNSSSSSPYINKLIEEIIHSFPYRMNVEELAQRLGINRSWLHKLCKETFGRPPTALMRHIWVHQALHLMQHTNLNNIDIALKLNYSEESSMAREFRKELRYSPNTARKRLTRESPEELLH